MNSITKITPEIYHELCAGLLRELDPQMSEMRWRRCFLDLADPERGAGYVLTDHGRIVGLLGAIYSERAIAGQRRQFCNVHSWYVRPEHRGKSLLLMRPVLKLAEHTVTDFSPTRSVVEISRRLGFERLDASAWLLLPTRGVAADIKEVDAGTVASLSCADQQIYHDHVGNGCGHLLLADGNGYCYVVFSRLRVGLFSYCAVHYISDRRRFVEHLAAFRRRLMERSGAWLVLVDSRYLQGSRPPRALRVSTYEKIYRPSGVAAADVDCLYSDVVNLQLSSIPKLRTLVADPIRSRAKLLRRWSSKLAPGLVHVLPECLSELEAVSCLLA